MADDFTDDFMEEEEESGSRAPFLIIAGLLLGFFALTLLCIAAFAMTNRNGEQDAVAEILAANATTEAQNLLVTQTVVAMLTEAARPTNTPTPTATAVPPTFTPTPTPAPTDTPVVQPADDNGDEEDENGLLPGDDNQNDNASGEPVLEGTSIFSGGAVGAGTPTPIPGGAAALPDTGLELWAIILAAAGLLAVLLIARRLRATTT